MSDTLSLFLPLSGLKLAIDPARAAKQPPVTQPIEEVIALGGIPVSSVDEADIVLQDSNDAIGKPYAVMTFYDLNVLYARGIMLRRVRATKMAKEAHRNAS
jgi:hypothetical protein